MARRSYQGDKRRRELKKKKKQEEKRAKRQNRDKPDGTPEDDQSYLEYLNPGGPQDARYIQEEDEEGDEESEDE